MTNDAAPGSIANYSDDLAWTLVAEFRQWYAANGAKGAMPRAFSGIRSDARQMVIILTGLPFDHFQRREFLIWLCREEDIVAYVYASHMGTVDRSNLSTREILAFYASSATVDISVDFDIMPHDDGRLSFEMKRPYVDAVGSGRQWQPFLGLQRETGEISAAASETYKSTWKQMRTRCLWRDRKAHLS